MNYEMTDNVLKYEHNLSHDQQYGYRYRDRSGGSRIANPKNMLLKIFPFLEDHI